MSSSFSTSSSATQAPGVASSGASLALPPAGMAVAVLGLSLAAFFSGVSMRVTDALLPSLASTFEVRLSAAAHVLTFFAVAYGLAQLMFGPLGDRFGKYRVITLACAAASLSSLVCALAPSLTGLIAGRVLMGASTAAMIPLSMAWIGDNVPYAQRQPVLARFLLGQILGMSAGVGLGGLAADYLHWRTPFVLMAGFFAFAFVALSWQMRRMPALKAVGGAAARSSVSPPARMGVVSTFAAVLALPWARVVLVAVLLEGAFVYGVFAFVATHVHQSFGMPMAKASALVMTFALGGLLYALASPWWVARLGEVGLVRVGGSLMALALATLAVAPSGWWVAPACTALGLGFYMMHNTLQLQATQMAPERRGAAVSAFASCFFLGQAAGVALMGESVARWGGTAGLWVGAVGVLGLAMLFAELRRKRRVAMG